MTAGDSKPPAQSPPVWLRDPYLEWTAREGVPVAEDFGVENPAPDQFDGETADKWLGIEKKKRKMLAKAKHPAKAIADEAAAPVKNKGKGGAPESRPTADTETTK